MTTVQFSTVLVLFGSNHGFQSRTISWPNCCRNCGYWTVWNHFLNGLVRSDLIGSDLDLVFYSGYKLTPLIKQYWETQRWWDTSLHLPRSGVSSICWNKLNRAFLAKRISHTIGLLRNMKKITIQKIYAYQVLNIRDNGRWMLSMANASPSRILTK